MSGLITIIGALSYYHSDNCCCIFIVGSKLVNTLLKEISGENNQLKF